MSDNTLQRKHGFGNRRGQGPRRRDVVGGAVSEQEREEIEGAFGQAGFRNLSEGVRTVCLAFSREARIRDLVAGFDIDRAA